MSKLRENVSLIQTTMNYFCSSAVFNFLTFKDDFLCLKLYQQEYMYKEQYIYTYNFKIRKS